MEQALNIGLIGIEQYILISYIISNFKSRYSTGAIYGVYIILASSVVIFVNPIYDQIGMRLLINGVISIVILMMIFDEAIKDIIYTYSIFVGISFTLDVLVSAIISVILPVSVINIYEPNILIMCISKSILFILMTLLGKISVKDTVMPNKYLLTITSMYLLSIVVTLSIMDQMVYEDRVLLLLIVLFMFWVNAINIYIYILSLRYYQKRQYTDAVKRIMEVQYKYTLQNQHSVDEIRKLKHDLNNKLIGLLYLVEQKQFDQAKDYIMELNKQIDSIETTYNTGNNVVDFILNQKSTICKKQGVAIYLEKIDVKEINIEIEDIASILGNALDNAIEAASQIDHEQKAIWIQIYNNKGYLVISIKNTFRPDNIKKGFKTTKEAKGHGIGIKSMRECVEKYNGDLILNHEGNIFNLKATLENEKAGKS